MGCDIHFYVERKTADGWESCDTWEKSKYDDEPAMSPYCQVEWEISYYDSAKDFLGTVLPRLWRLGKPEDVRCVFWFDS